MQVPRVLERRACVFCGLRTLILKLLTWRIITAKSNIFNHEAGLSRCNFVRESKSLKMTVLLSLDMSVLLILVVLKIIENLLRMIENQSSYGSFTEATPRTQDQKDSSTEFR